MKKLFLLCTMLLALVVGKAENETAQILNNDDGDYVLIPKGDVDNPPTLELNLTGKSVGYSFKILNDVGNNDGDSPNYNPNHPYYYDNCGAYLLITAPVGCMINLSGTVITEGTSWDWLEIHDGSTNSSPQLGSLFGNRSGSENNTVNVISSSENMLLFFRSDGSGVDLGVNVTATLINVDADDNGFVWNSDTYELVAYTGDGGNIVIPSSITTIGSNVFANNSDITSVDFSQATNLTAIGEKAFAYCGNIESINIPENVQTIGKNAFAGILIVYYEGTADDENDDNWGATVRNGQISGDFVLNAAGNTIAKYIGDGGEVQIPSTVTTIGDDAFSGRGDIESVDFSLATSLTTIGNSAFYYCDGLIEIAIPASVTTIGDNAFQYCDNLATVDFSLATTLTTIGEYAFASCGLDEIDIPSRVSTIGDNAFEGIKVVNYEGETGSVSDTWGALARNGQISGDFVLNVAGNTIIKYIGEGGEVQIPSMVTTIGDDAFNDRDDIESVDFSLATSLTTIDNAAFYDCDALTSIAIPASVETIGGRAFLGCDALESVDLSGATSLTTIDDYAFNNCDALTTIAIPASVETIGYMTFEGCDNLQTVDLSGATSLTTIGNSAFYDCDALISIAIPASVETIEYRAFYQCYALKSIDLNSATGLESIGGYAFADCGTISVDVPKTVTSIGMYAFNGMPNINYTGTANDDYSNNWGASARNGQVGNFIYSDSDHKSLVGCIITHGSVEIPAGVEYIGDRIFKNNVNVSVTIPSSVTSIDYSAFAGVANIINNSNYHTNEPWGATNNNKTIDGDFVYNDNNKTTIVGYIGEGGSIEIPAGVETINEYAFSGSGTLTAVDFSKTTGLSIGEYAFSGCGLTEVTIPANVSSLGAVIFAGNLNLAVINCEFPMEQSADVCPNGNWYWKTGGGERYPVKWQCNDWQLSDDGVLTVKANINYDSYDYYPWSDFRSQIESVEFASNVTAIGVYAFYGLDAMAEITIPSTITEIGGYAFYDCDALTEITIPATVQTMGDQVIYECDNLNIIYCEAETKPAGWDVNWNYGYFSSYGWGRIPALMDCKNLSLSDDGLLTVTKNYNYDDASYYPWYYLIGKEQLTAVEFTSNVTAIGDYAFYNYQSNLTSVTIPASVQSIGTEAFRDCYNLETAALSSNSALKTIGEQAFYGCYKLGNNNLDNAAGLESIGQQAFYNCAMTSVTIPAQVTTMGSGVFQSCDKLSVINCYAEKRPEGWSSSWNGSSATVMWDFTNWSLSDGVLSFNKDYDFESYSDYPWNEFRSQITGLDLGQNVTLIGNYAFYNCDNLESATIPAAVTKIGSSAFNDCDNLKVVDLSNTTSLLTIGNSAFNGCYNLESATIPSTVTSIGDNAFKNCSSLATVEISDNASLTSIGKYAFYGCNTLATIDLSKATSLDEIGQEAFYDCDALTSITIPASVTTMGNQVFYNSDYLPIIYCEAPSAGDNWNGDWNYGVFNGSWKRLPVAWDCNNWSLSSDGLLTVKKQYNFESVEEYPWYQLRSQITGVAFDNSNATFTSIGNYAFYCYSNLQTATIPAGVTAIGDHAFQGCNNLKVVDLSNTTTLVTIGGYAFYECSDLQSLTIPSSVTSIGNDAFRECQKLETIDLSKLTSLESIGSRAFYNCDQLASAYIPLSVQSVGEYAFYSCDNLGLIYIEADKSVPDGWDSNWSNYNSVAWDCTNWSLSASGKLTIKKQFTAENAESYPWYQMRSQITSVEFDNSNATFTAIGNYAFYGCENLTAIEIPATVESIGNYAFYYCQKLESVELSDNTSLESIGNRAFRECNALADIDLSKATKLKTIGQYAFYNCDGLTTMTIPASVTFIDNEVFSYSENMQFISCEAPSFPDGWNGSWNYGYFNYSWKYLPVLWDCNNVSLSEEGMLTVSKDYEFESYDNYPWYSLYELIKGVTFEPGVTVIGDYAFYSWGDIYPNLATVVIPATVTEIGEQAFYLCQNLTTADLKGAYGLTTIGNYAFYYCGLTEITIPANVTSIKEGAFEYCNNVESINLSGATSLERIETNAFYDCFKTFNIDVPSTVTYIGDGAFQNIKNLKYNGSYGSSSDRWGALARNAYVEGDFTYRDGTKTYLLGYTGNGGNITIPSTVVTIGDKAFYQKENITGVEITANVMQIGSSAFADCSNLATVNLSNATNLTTIGSGAFSGCNALTSVTIPSTVTSINNSAFNYCESLVTVDLSNATSLKTIGSSAFNSCENLSRVDLSNATSLKTIGDYAFEDCKALTSITIPATVTSIGSYAFSNCEKLATADLSNAANLERIGDGMFYNCKVLGMVVIPSKVVVIGNYAFQNCTSLRTVNLNNATSLREIYSNAFYECNNLTTIDLSKATNLERISYNVFYNCDALTQVTIPAKVREIGEGAFSYCNNLATVNMTNAKSLEYIGGSAFEECALASVAIPENVTYIGDDAFRGISALRTVSIPNGIIHVGENAFSGCSNLTFNVQNGFCYLGNSQNQYVVLVKPVAAGDLSSCTVNSGVKIVAVGAFNDCTVFPTTENGACYVGNNSNPYLILARAASDEISSCTINSNTRIIAPYAFWECCSLSSATITIPAGVEYVGYYAFGCGTYGEAPEFNCQTGDPSQWDGEWNPYGNNTNTNWAVDGWEFDNNSGLLTVNTDVVLWSQSYYPWYSLRDQIKSVKFTENVSRIGYQAFYNYTNMTTADFSNASGLESIGEEAFSHTYYLGEVDLSGATNLKSIGSYAFYHVTPNKIVIPASAEEIGEYAFWYWSSNYVVLCEADGPAEGWDNEWTTFVKIWHYNNNTLALSVNNSSYGSVRTNTVNDVDVNQVIPNGIYTYGDVVSIEAVSNSGSIFLRWNDGVTNNQRDITITDNLSLEAIFGSDGTVYTVNVGTNNSNWGTVTGTGNYVSGDYVELEAVPAEHYHFVRWSDDEENTDPNRSFYIDSDVSFYAEFEPDPCMVTVNVTGNGTVENEAQYAYGTCPTIYAYPDEGWYLAYWTTPNGTYFDKNYGFWIYNDTEVTAVFKPVQNVTVGANIVEAYGYKYNNCKFEAEVSGEYVIYGASINNSPYIYVYDADGYELASASGSDRITIDLEAGETYYIGAGNSNGAIEKMQLFIMASVSITAQGNGGTFEGDGEYTYGDDVTVTATPNEGMFFVKWSDGENKNVYSLKAYGNTTLNAEFSAIHQAVEGDNTVVGFYSGVTENYNCQFTPSYSGPYVFFSQSENDTYGILYDENKTVLESDDNSGENGNFSFTYELTAGQTYYIAASYVYTGNAGDEMNLVIGTPVNVTATVDGNGSVQGTGMYAYGSKVTLRANPESGNRFVRWSDLSTANPYQFTVYEDVELQAIFADESEDVYAVSAVVNNNSYGSVSGGSNYTAGERVELAVTANSGYTFICWTDGNSQNPRVFNASENVSLMAVLTPEGTTVHTVSATANDANMGNVTGGRYYADGETATINAVPASGYKFVRWNDGTTTNPLVFTVTGDTEIEAMFVDESTPVYTVSVGVASASANFGSVSGGGVFISGEPVSLTASAIEHYQFVKWSNNETANPYNFNVSSNVDVAAVFEPMNYNVTVVAENGIVTNGDGPRKYGTWTTISVQPAEHYHFVGWFDGQTSTTRTEQVLGDLEFTALFEKDKYQINAWADNDATVSGTGEYEYEATATLTITPAEGYHFVKWSDDATAQNPRQIVVDKNLDLYAQTAINEYQVTVDAANGTVEGISNPYTHGSEGTFTAVPADGYRFVRWSATNRENPFTMQITSNVVLRPLFASPDDDVYDVVVSATEGGSVTGGGIFLKDEKTTITATPDQGYHFVKWSNGQTETSFELTVTESVNLKAEFDKNVHTLTVSAGANGTVTGGGTVEAGSSAEISATAAEGYHFVKWSDGNTSASRTVVVDKDIELTAEFAINTYTVKASATNGTVTGAGTYTHGAEATLTATAAEGYHFVKWSDGVETATRKVTVKSDLSFTAEFAINTYVVKVTAANGTVTGEGTYEHGAKAKLSVTAAEGYHFVKWSDGETKATRTVVVTDNLTLTAEFEINSYTVRASATNGTVEGTGTYNYGAEATLTAVANTGYHFTKWSDGVETATRKVTVKSDLNFTAMFATNSYTISVDSAANGTITGAGTYTYGATATLEATANKGYHFVMWTDSVMTATRTVEVTGNATFSAVFAGDSYELTVKAKNGTVEGAGTYENGTEATLTAVADAGYIFSKWDDDNTDNPRTVIVTGNKTYTATFKKALYSVTVNAENGQITGAADSLELGATVTLTAIADEGYHFVMWSDSVTENPRTVTLTAELLQQVKDSIEFTAIFEVNTDVADEAAEAVNIFAYGNTIVVENATSDIFVYNAMGRLIERVAAEAGRTEIKIDGAGIHVVKTGNTAKRVMIND